METVIKTEYQDIYRIDNGVLLIVNKYERDKQYGERGYLNSSKNKPYNPKTQNLRVLKEDTTYKEYSFDTGTYEDVVIIPSGTVLCGSFPVKVTRRENWSYEIKTTASCFSGNKLEMNRYIEDIMRIINGE